MSKEPGTPAQWPKQRGALVFPKGLHSVGTPIGAGTEASQSQAEGAGGRGRVWLSLCRPPRWVGTESWSPEVTCSRSLDDVVGALWGALSGFLQRNPQNCGGTKAASPFFPFRSSFRPHGLQNTCCVLACTELTDLLGTRQSLGGLWCETLCSASRGVKGERATPGPQDAPSLPRRVLREPWKRSAEETRWRQFSWGLERGSAPRCDRSWLPAARRHLGDHPYSVQGPSFPGS